MSDGEDEILLERVREAIRRGGGVPQMSEKTGIAKKTLEKYLAKRSMASLANAAKIARASNVTLDSLVGDAAPASVAVAAPRLALDPKIMLTLGRLVARVYRTEGVRLQGEAVAAEAAELYNELARRVSDWTDAGEIEAVMPQLERLLVRKLQAARAAPGTGKRLA